MKQLAHPQFLLAFGFFMSLIGDFLKDTSAYWIFKIFAIIFFLAATIKYLYKK